MAEPARDSAGRFAKSAPPPLTPPPDAPPAPPKATTMPDAPPEFLDFFERRLAENERRTAAMLAQYQHEVARLERELTAHRAAEPTSKLPEPLAMPNKVKWTLDKFTGTGKASWSDWSFTFRSYMGSNGIALNPEASDPSYSTLTEPQNSALFFDLIGHVTDDARKTIKSAVTAGHITEGDGLAAWNCLIKRFRPSDVVSKHSVLQDYNACKLGGFLTMDAFIDAKLTLRAELENLGDPISMDSFISAVIMGLPEDYQSFTVAWFMHVDPKWDDIKKFTTFKHQITQYARLVTTSDNAHAVSTRECWDFANTGKCRFGDKCRYKHTKKPIRQVAIGKYADVTCKDCGQIGHISSSYGGCPKHEDLSPTTTPPQVAAAAQETTKHPTELPTIPVGLDGDNGLPPLPLNDAGALMAQEMEDGEAYVLSATEQNNMSSALADYVNFG